MSGSTYTTAHAQHAEESTHATREVVPARSLRVGLLGHGTVGRAFTELIGARHADLARSHGVDVQVTTVLVRDATRQRDGALDSAALVDDRRVFLAQTYDVVVEALGGHEPAGELVSALLARGTPVVTANKALLAARGEELLRLAQRTGAVLRGEAAVAAGVPVLGALEHALAGTTLTRIDAVLNGTSNFVLSQVARASCTIDEATAEAQRRGFCEADPDLDLTGTDAAQKLQILLLAAGRPGAIAEVRGVHHVTPDDTRVAAECGFVIRPVAHASLRGDAPSCWVAPAAVPIRHSLAAVGGVNNAVVLAGEPTGDVVLAGPGAGGPATAAALLDDVLAVVRGGGSYASPHGSRFPAAASAPDFPWLVSLGPAVRGPGLDELLDFVREEGVRFRSLREVELSSGPVLAGITRPASRECIERATTTVLTVGAAQTARAFRALPAPA